MTSNILAGERRWVSARRTGMTVLGKVAVPKPLNLPSQRLENHGVDPNVEIVPKGSLGWGSRPSSASSPWGSASLSPNADGSASSPSQLSGRPSSAGSGSRPSTAGSDRTLERTANAWGPSSRPSSASGVLPSNQPTTSLRPHSAETRPSSSQLSRFAEPLSDSSTGRASTGFVEKVGVMSSENDNFSLSSGDFPTLNSSKESSTKNPDTRDQGSHSRPSSGSGKIGKTETSQTDAYSVTVSTCNRDGPQNADDGIQPGLAKWHGEPHPYHNASIPPPQFDAWRGPSINAPAGVWYRGPPSGPPYGAPVGPGGFPMEPFPYYCPQIPPPALTNSQPVPLSVAGPRGHHHPKNGELYRPQMPDAFVHPGTPFRPGFYRGPVTYEGYYGPPMGYGNSNAREVPFKGMAAQSVYNRYPTPGAPDSGHAHASAGKNGSIGKILSEHIENTHSGDGSAQCKVLLKQHNEWEGKDADIIERMPMSNSSYSKKGGQSSRVPTRREWGADHDCEEEMCSSRMTEGENSSLNCGNDQVDQDLVATKVNLFQNVRNSVVDSGQMNRHVVAESSPGIPQASVAMKRGLPITATSRESTLMQKIEGLNVKVRGSDGRYDGLQTLESDEQKFGSQTLDTNVNDVLTKAGNVPVADEKVHALNNMGALSNERIPTFEDKTSQSSFPSRKPGDHVHCKSGDTSKGRLHSPDSHGRLKRPIATELPGTLAASISSSSNLHASNIQPVVAANEYPSGYNGGESSTEINDSTDSQAQRVKMKELAKQRALQLQKEEEERIREQKAKALAKLEELNRRTQGNNASKTENVLGTTDDDRPKCDESGIGGAKSEAIKPALVPIFDDVSEVCVGTVQLGDKSEAIKPALVPIFDDVSQVCVGTVQLGDKSANLAACFPSDRPKAVAMEPPVLDGQSLTVKGEVKNADASDSKAFPQMNEGGVSRPKRNSFKPKQNAQQSKSTRERSQMIVATEATKDVANVPSTEISLVAPGEVLPSEESNFPPRSPTVESPAQQRKKGNWSSRKHKLDEATPISAPPLVAPNQTSPHEACAENENCNAGQLDLDFGSAQLDFGSAQGVVTFVDRESSKQQSSLHVEEAHGRVNNHRKHQNSRRFPRSQQSNDNVMWAPVRSQNKFEPASEINQKTMQESVTSAKSDHQMQSNLKSKRAEMERYVPKPVAKELAQQGSIQQPVLTSSGLLASDESADRVESGFGSSGSLETGSSVTCNVYTDSRDVNKQVKAHGAWRQRGLAEAPSRGPSSATPNTIKNTQASLGQNQSGKPEVHSERVEGKISRDTNASNDRNVSKDFDAVVTVTPVRDQAATGKGKRHVLRADRSLGSGHGHEKKFFTGEADKNHIQFSDSDIRHSEKMTFSKESRVFDERSSSQWQPKSHPSSSSSQRGTRSIAGPDVNGQMSGVVKKDSPSQPKSHVFPHAKEMSEKDFSWLDQSVSENRTSLEVANVGHQGHKKERKFPTVKPTPYSLIEVTFDSDESTFAMSADGQSKQHFSSDVKRSRNQNNHSGTSQEFSVDGNQESQRNYSHYEYHPVGSQNNCKPEKIEDGSHNVGPRYKNGGQSQPKRGRGNFHGRQSSSIRVDTNSG